jgi:hypothetical protein
MAAYTVSDANHVSLSSEHPLISWRSILAGSLVTFLTLVFLLALGMAFGGVNLDEETSLSGAGKFAGIWFLISSVVSLFAGSYFAARVSKFRNTRIGSAQAIIIASLFFGAMLWQSFSVLGAAGRLTGRVVGGTAVAAGASVAAASQSSIVNEIAEDALGNANIQPDRIQAVVTGVASRLVRGDTEAAQNYLARQTGISPEEANQRIAAAKVQVDQALVKAKEATANALQATGWTIVLLVAFGAIAAIVGGALGARTNSRKPLVVDDRADARYFESQPV